MSRLDRARLDAATFPVTLEVPTRFDDLDIQGHVNNAAVVVLLQEARANFNRAAGLAGLMGPLRTMVAALTVEYAVELRHPQPVSIGTGVAALGRTSFTLVQVARQSGRPGVYAQAVMVIADANGPVALPDTLRDAYQRLTIG